ncbi:hypothetical protein CRG98_042263 [Punica granatum]|uniref:Uncharacterized protein n=1 Tax=Punica granatum TaxID=22663 RepID=A0A2I0I056_PUNGR|nr:hypothetical protein CRG98_042263 [Punica granatum]
MAEEQQPVISEQDAPPMPAQSIPEDTRVISSPTSTTYSGALPTHFPSPAQASSNVVDPVRFAALEGIVNQLAANMNTNMTELMAMLRDQNRASSSHTPPPERRATVHRNPIDPPIYVTDSEDMSFPAMTYVPTEQHGSEAPIQWTCGVRGVLPGGFCKVQGVLPGRLYGAVKLQVGTDPKGTDP